MDAQVPSIEDMVLALKELDQAKKSHLIVLEELERQRQSLTTLLQKRLAQHKQQLDEMVARSPVPNLTKKEPVAIDSSTLSKLDAILTRLDRLEKRLDAAEKKQAIVNPVPGFSY
jgi:hypothetical protein